MKKNPKILVLLALYNGEKYISDQLLSIIEQESVNIDVLISDNGSTDNSLNIINKLINIKKIKNIKILNNKSTKGFANNFYFLIRNVKNTNDYDYYAFSDQDDIFLLNKYSLLISELEKNSADCCSSGLFELKDNKINKTIYQKNKIRKYDFLFEGAGQGCSFLINRNAFTETRSYLIKYENQIKDFYFHDWLIYLITRILNYKWLFLREPLTIYRQHEENNFGSKFSINGIKKRLNRIFSGWYKNQITLAYHIASNINSKYFVDFSPFLLIKKRNFFQKINLSIFIFKHGRRRFKENLILFYAVLFNYI